MPADALAEIGEIRRELDAAVDLLLTQAEAGLAVSDTGASGREQMRAALRAILEACSFHDLTSQRLARLEALVAGGADTRPDAHLLNGPMALDAAPDQAAIDALFEAASPSPT